MVEMLFGWSQERWIGREIRKRGMLCGRKTMSKGTEMGTCLRNEK